MSKYLKLFNDSASYEAWKLSEDYVLPNVSYTEDGNLHYNPMIEMVKEIEFYVKGTASIVTLNLTGKALNNMTWNEFVDSEYNILKSSITDISLKIKDDKINFDYSLAGSKDLKYSTGEYVKPDDAIMEGETYTF